ncbi:MAG: xanthine dehydrogenase family protein molybdopterin-binding subunit, partial [Nocardioides sp.]
MTVTEERPVTEIGSPRRRKEDARLVVGRTRWTDNISLPGMLHLAMVRTPVAHATITSIDVETAKNSPGVIAVFTGADLADEQGSLPCAWPITADQKAPAHPSIAVDTVNFAGEIVACIVARSAVAAKDAVELVDVEYDELPVVVDMAAAAEGGNLTHPELGTNVSATWVFDSAEAGTGGNVEDAIRGAEVLIERTYRQQRLMPAFMEPRSVVSDPTGEQTTLWSATQIPHILKLMLALTCGISESKLRVIAPDVGGGFGGKLQVTPEEVTTLVVSRRLGKPCKYTETRSESLLAGHHGSDQIQKLTLAATREGTVTGLKVELLADMGAYLGLVTPGVPILGAFMYNAIYRFPSYRFQCKNILTNKNWTDAYRGAGRSEATFAIERLMDELAVEICVDPLEIRERNWIKHEEFPFTTVCGLEYD